jgi:hypothetical protein
MLSSFCSSPLHSSYIHLFSSTYSPSTFPLYRPCVSASIFSDLIFVFTYLGFFFSLLSTSLLVSSPLMCVDEGSVIQLLFGGWDLYLVSLLSRHPVPFLLCPCFPCWMVATGSSTVSMYPAQKKIGGPSLLWLLHHPTLFITLFYNFHHLAHRRRPIPFNTPRESTTLSPTFTTVKDDPITTLNVLFQVATSLVSPTSSFPPPGSFFVFCYLNLLVLSLLSVLCSLLFLVLIS